MFKTLTLRRYDSVMQEIKLTAFGEVYAYLYPPETNVVEAPDGYLFTGEIRPVKTGEHFFTHLRGTKVGEFTGKANGQSLGRVAILAKIETPPDEYQQKFVRDGEPRKIFPGEYYWDGNAKTVLLWNVPYTSRSELYPYSLLYKKPPDGLPEQVDIKLVYTGECRVPQDGEWFYSNLLRKVILKTGKGALTMPYHIYKQTD